MHGAGVRIWNMPIPLLSIWSYEIIMYPFIVTEVNFKNVLAVDTMGSSIRKKYNLKILLRLRNNDICNSLSLSIYWLLLKKKCFCCFLSLLLCLFVVFFFGIFFFFFLIVLVLITVECLTMSNSCIHRRLLVASGYLSHLQQHQLFYYFLLFEAHYH